MGRGQSSYLCRKMWKLTCAEYTQDLRRGGCFFHEADQTFREGHATIIVNRQFAIDT